MSKSFLIVDNSELKDFADKLKSGIHKDKYIINALAETANKYLNDLIAGTPVYGQPNPQTGRVWSWPRYPDHPKGTLRDAWKKDNKNLKALVTHKGNGYEITLVNTTEWASWVEKGHTKWIYGRNTHEWVQGTFFVKKAEIRWQNGKLDRELSIKIMQWLMEVFY